MCTAFTQVTFLFALMQIAIRTVNIFRCTLFAFEPWHSAIEFRRYLRRFVHHFSTIDVQHDIYRTMYNQYDSMIVPAMVWLKKRGVHVRHGVRVEDLGFVSGGDAITVTSISTLGADGPAAIKVTPSDCVYVTNGSMTADKAFGSMTKAPHFDASNHSGAWNLWEKLAEGRPEFGNPAAFNGNIEESSWISFTVTVHDPLFLELMERFSGGPAGTEGLITFKQSSWLLTLSIYHQPFFPDQPEGVAVWWGYGLFHDRPGDFVKKRWSNARVPRSWRKCSATCASAQPIMQRSWQPRPAFPALCPTSPANSWCASMATGHRSCRKVLPTLPFLANMPSSPKMWSLRLSIQSAPR
jgi:myosin-crossreactive antigen